MSHLKRHMMPKFWGIPRKGKKYTVSPMPGPHERRGAIPLLVLVRDTLKYAETGNEAKCIIKRGAILIDGVARKDERYPAGFMDAITIKPTKEHFRISLGRSGLFTEKIGAAEAGRKLCIIRKKYATRGGTQCITLHDGRTAALGKDASSYKPGDTIVMEVPGQKICGHFKVEKGANALITNGRNMGMRGKVRDVRDRKFMTQKSIVILDCDGREIETLKNYVMALPPEHGEARR